MTRARNASILLSRFDALNAPYTDANGNVGIGTASPVGRLTIQGAAGTSGINQGIGLLYSNGTQYGALGLNNSTGWPQLMARAGAGLTFHVNSDLVTTGEVMRLDTSGNLGLGVTPSAWSGGFKALQLPGGSIASFASGTNLQIETGAAYYQSSLGTYAYLTTGAVPTLYRQLGGQHQWYTAPSGTAGNAITFTQAMTLDASGSLLIAKTATGGVTLQAQGNSTNGTYLQLDQAGVANRRFGIPAGSDAFVWTGFTGGTYAEQMRLDASGNLLVGATTSPGGSPRLITAGSGNQEIQFLHSDNVTGRTVTLRLSNTSSGYYTYGPYIRTEQGPGFDVYNYLAFGINNAERARIDSSGNLLVGTTTNSGSNKVVITAANSGTGNAALSFVGGGTNNAKNIECSTGVLTSSYGVISFGVANPGNGYFLSFSAPDGGYNYATRGSIALSGTSTAYNTSSDYRLKKDIAPMTGALAKVALLKPVTYKWLDDSDGEGFVAHELAEVMPQAVTGEKDAVDEEGNPQYQGIDTSFLVATLTAAIKEQQAIIEQLKADVAALKAAA